MLMCVGISLCIVLYRSIKLRLLLIYLTRYIGLLSRGALSRPWNDKACYSGFSIFKIIFKDFSRTFKGTEKVSQVP